MSDQPSEEAMRNLYQFLGRVLPKYLGTEIREEQRRDAKELNSEPDRHRSFLSREELPNNLSAKDIHQFTNIKLRTVYDLMNKSPECGGIPSFRIGKPLLSDREEFLRWWDETKEKGRKWPSHK
ncbi:helix-turn-helix domain-containing protein [Paenibacillus lemnae]|uniref:Helix-turn-helix domain-containing protein n=1 Tax=Paenibacillus lemnae TaxID=1330551 RepID=A0A848MA46_PAELE|nr:helix-turn-helix domain-containing protein [Paenibacillus lemnae]NMO97466.1 helix-turn-helix domain-containing protein [Paenibacillus lemnae]